MMESEIRGMEYIVRTENLSKQFGNEKAVSGMDMKIPKGEIYGFLGASGVTLVETPSYYPHLTAYENLEAIRKILGVPKERIAEVLEVVRLSDVAGKKVKGCLCLVSNHGAA